MEPQSYWWNRRAVGIEIVIRGGSPRLAEAKAGAAVGCFPEVPRGTAVTARVGLFPPPAPLALFLTRAWALRKGQGARRGRREPVVAAPVGSGLGLGPQPAGPAFPLLTIRAPSRIRSRQGGPLRYSASPALPVRRRVCQHVLFPCQIPGGGAVTVLSSYGR